MNTKTPSTYGPIANIYDTILTYTGFKRGVEKFLDRIDFELSPSANILDAGCGTGLISRYLARRYPRASIYATDINRDMLHEMRNLLIREGLPPERLVIGWSDLTAPHDIEVLATGNQVKLAEGGLDAVFVSGALEHVPLAPTIEKLVRLIRPGGMFFNLGIRRGPTGAVLGMVHRFRPYPLADLRAAFAAAGLTEIRTIRLSVDEFPANLSRIAILARKIA